MLHKFKVRITQIQNWGIELICENKEQAEAEGESWAYDTAPDFLSDMTAIAIQINEVTP